MMPDPAGGAPPLCPSAPPQVGTGVAFGVVGGTAEAPRLGYLADLLPITAELLALTDPVNPTEVFRFAAPCAGSACVHFDGANCRLAQRIVQLLPDVVERLPPCRLRPACRWWRQEGAAACVRCPQVVTESPHASEPFRQAANPACRESASSP
ncbi:MAG: hypothetical protein K0S78_1468 [Thermomicrobiales bacterium]|jgi:hypothetical protein|nr:hypothetical protein [Thermomicrobiales bacterium]MDF3038725.1 hypothetical protein [Thermomicrobiales bacterium]